MVMQDLTPTFDPDVRVRVFEFLDEARASRTRGVLQQTVHASGQKACSLARCNSAVGVELAGDILV